MQKKDNNLKIYFEYLNDTYRFLNSNVDNWPKWIPYNYNKHAPGVTTLLPPKFLKIIC